jgi:sodium pump decarboxylase gamma subunit
LSADFQTGLMVSVVGLAITFSALLIFIGIIVLLKTIFPYKEEKSEETDDASHKEETITVASSDKSEEELTAAIAAVIYLHGQRSNQLGAALTAGKSPFWTAD